MYKRIQGLKATLTHCVNLGEIAVTSQNLLSVNPNLFLSHSTPLAKTIHSKFIIIVVKYLTVYEAPVVQYTTIKVVKQ